MTPHNLVHRGLYKFITPRTSLDLDQFNIYFMDSIPHHIYDAIVTPDR